MNIYGGNDLPWLSLFLSLSLSLSLCLSLFLSLSLSLSLSLPCPGVGAFYRGVSPALVRAFPANGALFLAYEMTKRVLG